MPTNPNKLPTWADNDVIDPSSGQPNVSEPPEGRKLSGWNRREIPPRQWFNWLARITKQNIEWLLGSGTPLSSDVGTANAQDANGAGHTHKLNGASESVATDGIDNELVMTSIRTRQSIESHAIGYQFADYDGVINIVDLSATLAGDVDAIAFNSIGNLMIVIDSNRVLYQFLLTPDDPNTVLYGGVSLDVSVQVPNGGSSIRISDDNTKLIVKNSVTSDFYQWSISPSDYLLSATYDGSITLDAGIGDFIFDESGTRISTVGSSAPESVKNYILSTAWDITTAGASSTQLDISAEVASPKTIEKQKLTGLGYKYFIADNLNEDRWSQYANKDLSFPGTMNSASAFINHPSFGAAPSRSCRFTPTGLHLVIPGVTNQTVKFRATNILRGLR